MLYDWLNCPPHELKEARDLDGVLCAGGEWRGRLARLLHGLQPGEKLVYRRLEGDALLADGRVLKWKSSPGNDAEDGLFDKFRLLHNQLREIGKPWMPELSPCRTSPLEQILSQFGVRVTEQGRIQFPFKFDFADVAAGPWTRHLSARERKWLKDKWPQPSQVTLRCEVVILCGQRADALPVLEMAELSPIILSSVLDGRAGHVDRWPIPLPTLQSTPAAGEESESDRDVRKIFRAISSRIGQNGRLCPTYHSYLVLNLWEPPRRSLGAMGASHDSDGQFAPATEFIFAARDSNSAVDEALRTVFYLALVALNEGRTIHSVTQRLFRSRRPSLRVGPGRQWEFSTDRAWAPESSVDGIIPMGLQVRFPVFRKYNDLRAALASQLSSLGSLLDDFRETIWCAALDGFFGFPWDSDSRFDGSPDPAFFGRAAGRLITSVVESMSLIDVWTILGETDNDRAAFEAAFGALLSECGKTVSAEEHSWIYRAFLANAVLFDELGFEHRQVPLPIADDNGVFVAAGTYLMTHRIMVAADQPLDLAPRSEEWQFARLEDLLGRFNSLQIAAHAARAILSTAAVRTIRRMNTADARRLREAEARRVAGETVSKFVRYLDVTRRNLLPFMGLPGRLLRLWERDGALDRITHGQTLESARALRDATVSGIHEALDEHSAKLVIHALDLALAAPNELEYQRLNRVFKDEHRGWADDVPKAVGKLVSKRVGPLKDAWTNVTETEQQLYPVIPGVFAEALKRFFTPTVPSVQRTDTAVNAFLYDEADGIRAGFAAISREGNAPAKHLEQLGNEYAQWRDWCEVYVLVRRDGHLSGTTEITELDLSVQSAIGSNGVGLVLVGHPLPRLKG